MNTDQDNYMINWYEEKRAKNRRPIKHPRQKRLIVLDKETGTIHQVRRLNLDEINQQEQLKLDSRHYGRTYQFLHKVEFFLTNSKT